MSYKEIQKKPRKLLKKTMCCDINIKRRTRQKNTKNYIKKNMKKHKKINKKTEDKHVKK